MTATMFYLPSFGQPAHPLSDAEFGTRPDYRREYAEANSGRPA